MLVSFQITLRIGDPKTMNNKQYNKSDFARWSVTMLQGTLDQMNQGDYISAHENLEKVIRTLNNIANHKKQPKDENRNTI